jgi:hypothetical protein
MQEFSVSGAGSLFRLAPSFRSGVSFFQLRRSPQLPRPPLLDSNRTKGWRSQTRAMSGVAGRGLQALLGHKDARMTMRYSHLPDSYLRAAVDGVVLGGEMEKCGTNAAPPNTSKSARAKTV